MLRDVPIIIDVEASGFGQLSYPIEIGLALASGERYCSLIAPHPEWIHWDESAEKLHKVSRTLLEKSGKPIEEVATDLNRLLENRTIYTDGWVVDKPWIIRLFHVAGMKQLFSISALEIILTEAQMAIWAETKNRVIQELNLSRHRASNDALIVQKTYMQTLQRTSQYAV